MKSSKNTKIELTQNTQKKIGLAIPSSQLGYVKLYRVSMSDLCFVIKTMPSAAIVLLFLSEHCIANVNAIQVRRETVSIGTGLSANQVTRATHFLLKYNLITKKVHQKYTYYEINTRYISKGQEYYNQCYYEAQSINPIYAKQFYNVKVTTINHVEK